MEFFFRTVPGPAALPGPAPDRAWREMWASNTAVLLELEWPRRGRARKPGRQRLDDKYEEALYEWVATTSLALAEGESAMADLPQPTRPALWRPGMGLFPDANRGQKRAASPIPAATPRKKEPPQDTSDA